MSYVLLIYIFSLSITLVLFYFNMIKDISPQGYTKIYFFSSPILILLPFIVKMCYTVAVYSLMTHNIRINITIIIKFS